jgi:hypothetical protein
VLEGGDGSVNCVFLDSVLTMRNCRSMPLIGTDSTPTLTEWLILLHV